MAYCPDTGKTYMFGGIDDRYVVRDDLWEWDGEKWALVAVESRPATRADAGLAYDPVRKTLILYGGGDTSSMYYRTYSDTWEWNPVSRKWSELLPTTRPDHSYGHRLVTDVGRGKILLFGGMPGKMDGPYKDPMLSSVWEWDGAKVTWTDRTPVGSSDAPGSQMFPVVSYDESRQKLLVFSQSTSNVGSVPSNSTCASGHCVDGVCCNSECQGTCVSCNQTGRAGVCSAYVAGTDPEGECTKGGGPCGSSCNGAGSCAFPAFGSTCGACMICDGAGTCMTSYHDPTCLYPPMGGTGGSTTTRTSYAGSSGSGGLEHRTG